MTRLIILVLRLWNNMRLLETTVDSGNLIIKNKKIIYNALEPKLL